MAEQEVVVITGCSAGLGKALALAFHGHVAHGQTGYNVHATARSIQAIRDLAEIGIATHKLDITDQAQIQQCVTEILKDAGWIDILINNAGMITAGPVAEQPVEELQRIFDVNVWGTLSMVQQVVPHMASKRHGLIVNIGSVSATFTTPFGGGYSASKAALHAFTTAMAMELCPLGVRTLLVEAGAIKTDIVAHAFDEFSGLCAR